MMVMSCSPLAPRHCEPGGAGRSNPPADTVLTGGLLRSLRSLSADRAWKPLPSLLPRSQKHCGSRDYQGGWLLARSSRQRRAIRASSEMAVSEDNLQRLTPTDLVLGAYRAAKC